MAASSGASSGSTMLSSEEDLQNVMDQRKRNRMLSNRESARRSRMRKQKHLDDLLGQVNQIKKDNNQILTNMNVTTQLYLKIEAENSVLRAQMSELACRLESLNGIIDFINSGSGNGGVLETVHHQFEDVDYQMSDDLFMYPMNSLYLNRPIMY